MFKYINKSVFVCLISASALVCGQPPTNNLNSTDPMMRGHIVALYLDHLFVNYGPIADYNASILVSFNESENIIELEILGKQTTIDRAKKSTDSFREKLLKVSLDALNKHFDLALSEDDIFIQYINAKSLGSLLVFRNGKYTLE